MKLSTVLVQRVTGGDGDRLWALRLLVTQVTYLSASHGIVRFYFLYFFILCVLAFCLLLCLCTTRVFVALRGQKGGEDPLELEGQTAVTGSFHVGSCRLNQAFD